MFGIGGSVRIYYCPTPINLRKSFDGLAGAVEEYIKQDPESGHVFAFFSRNKKLVKLLQWEDGGFVIWMKRLEQGGFHIPQSADGRIELTSRELAAILSGIKPQRYYKRYSKKLGQRVKTSCILECTMLYCCHPDLRSLFNMRQGILK